MFSYFNKLPATQKDLPVELSTLLNENHWEMNQRYEATHPPLEEGCFDQEAERNSDYEPCGTALEIVKGVVNKKKYVAINFYVSGDNESDVTYRHFYSNGVWCGSMEICHANTPTLEKSVGIVLNITPVVRFEGDLDFLVGVESFWKLKIRKNSELVWQGNVYTFNALSAAKKTNCSYSSEQCLAVTQQKAIKLKKELEQVAELMVSHGVSLRK